MIWYKKWVQPLSKWSSPKVSASRLIKNNPRWPLFGLSSPKKWFGFCFFSFIAFSFHNLQNSWIFQQNLQNQSEDVLSSPISPLNGTPEWDHRMAPFRPVRSLPRLPRNPPDYHWTQDFLTFCVAICNDYSRVCVCDDVLWLTMMTMMTTMNDWWLMINDEW